MSAHVTPPEAYVHEIEQEVLGSLLSGGDFRKVMGFLKEDHFVADIHRILFSAIKCAFEQYGSSGINVAVRLLPADIDHGFVKTVGKSAKAYMAQLATQVIFGNASLENSARAVISQWARLKVGEEGLRLNAAASDPSVDVSQMIPAFAQDLDNIMAEVRAGPRRKTRVSVSEASNRAIATSKEAMQRGGGITGITTGLSDVNRLTGGLQPRDLTLIGARPSMGKTTIGLSMAVKAARSGAGVGFISLEMDADKLAARAITDIAYDWNIKVPYVDLLRGSLDMSQLESLEHATVEMHKLPLLIEDQSGMTMTDIRIKTEAMMEESEKMGSPLKVLFVDHLGLIRASGRYAGNRVNEIAEMTSGLKGLAREYGLAVALLSQLNRAVETRDDKRPMLSDLRDSGAIEQDADTIIFLYREAYYLERSKTSNMEQEAERISKLADCQNKLEFIIAKQRNGPIATVDLFVDIACSAVRNSVRF